MAKLDVIRDARFWSRVKVLRNAKNCWEWLGPKDEFGYGIHCGERAHRYAYKYAFGHIPIDRVVRHTCDNPSCCNPFHYCLGTHVENRQDCVDRKRHASGERHGRSTISDEIVQKIRDDAGILKHREIADKHGVSRPTVTRILNGTQRRT